MTAVRVPVLRCDSATCDREYLGQPGLTFADLRSFASLHGWMRTPSGRGDYCPTHRPVPVTTWSPDGSRRVTRHHPPRVAR